MNDQHAAIEELNQIVRVSEQFQRPEAAARLLKIATGDGVVLVFYTGPEAPAQCAVEISRALAGQLHAKLSPAEKSAIEQSPTTNLIAYDRYLRAKKLGSVPRIESCGLPSDSDVAPWQFKLEQTRHTTCEPVFSSRPKA